MDILIMIRILVLSFVTASVVTFLVLRHCSKKKDKEEITSIK